MKRLKTVKFRATPEQMKRLQPLQRTLEKSHGYIWGQVYLSSNPRGEKVGTMRFHFLPAEIGNAMVDVLRDRMNQEKEEK